MKTFYPSLIFFFFTLITFGQTPFAPSIPVTEEHCGITIVDEYRNLENLEDEQVKEWLKQQGDYAKSELHKIPRRQHLIDQQLEFDQRSSASLEWLTINKNDEYFYIKILASENVGKLYYRKGFTGDEILLYDPKDFKPELENEYLINYIRPDWDGEKVLISLTESGKELSEMVILDMKTKKLLPDLITNCWPSDGSGISWLPDNSGFIYLHYPVIDPTSEMFLKNMRSVCYKIGQDPSELNEVFSNTTNPEINIQPEDFPVVYYLDQSHKYVFGQIAGASNYSDTYYAEIDDISTGKLNWKFLYSKDDKIFRYTIQGDDLVFIMGKGASNFKLCKTPLSNPDFENPTVLVGEKEEEVFQSIIVTADGLFFGTNKHGVESKLFHLKDSVVTEIELPEKSGNVYLTSKGENFSDLWVSTMGWANSFIRYQYNLAENTFEEAELVPVPEFPEYDDLVVEEIVVPSHDGVEVPLSLIYKKDLKMDGKNPTLVYGRGSYGDSMHPFFSANFLLFAAEGGIIAIAHVRGGGEKGVEWHLGGKKATKPNTWKDAIACVEYMIEKKYTSNKHTAIWSFSSGGVFVGRAITERPDLFAVAIPQVGVMNTMRFEETPNGANNVKEFGTIKNPEDCKALYEMDPYLHIEKGVDYPATLVTAGINDPRVIVWQPAKFAAKLQVSQKSDKPILFLVDYESGHGRGDTRLKTYESRANVYSFTLWQTGHPAYQIKEILTKKGSSSN